MAIIYSYPRIDTVAGTDIMVLADSSEEDFATKSVTMAQLKTFFGSGGGGNAISVFYEGALVTNNLSTLNFTGSGLNISSTTTKVTVNVPGGGGSGDTYTLAATQGSVDVDLDLVSSNGSPGTITSTVKFTPGPGIDITAGSANDIQIENLNKLIVNSDYIEIIDHPTNPGEKQILPQLSYRRTFQSKPAPDNRGITLVPSALADGYFIYTVIDTGAGLKYDNGIGGTGAIQVKLGTGLGFDGSGNIENTNAFVPGQEFSWLPALCSNGATTADLGASDLEDAGIINITNRVGRAYTTNDPAWIRYEFYIAFDIAQAWSNVPPLGDYLIIARRDPDSGKTVELPVAYSAGPPITYTPGTNLNDDVNGSIQITKATAAAGADPTYMWNRIPQTGMIAYEGTTYAGYFASLNYKGAVGASGLEYVYENGVNWWNADAIGAECVLAGTIIAHP